MRDREQERIMIVAGEASGDLHAGNLAEAIRKRRPGIELFGMGGEAMRRAGVDTRVDISSLAVVGLWEVLSHISEIKGAFDTMKKAILRTPPKLLVLIDYPDFNLRLAKVAKRAGVPVIYYISPQVWAWRKGRLKVMAGLVRKMLVVYPFEEEYYRQAGIDCRFVGNPLLDDIGEVPKRDELAGRLGLDSSRPVMGMLPGSRRKEVYNQLPAMLETFALLKRDIPDLQGIIPVANTLSLADFEPYMAGVEGIRLVEHDSNSVMAMMDAAVVASGTATLQTAIHRKPMVIIYRLSTLTYLIGRLLIRLKHIGLVNIVAGYEAVPELIQHQGTPKNIAAHLKRFFTDKEYYNQVVERLDRVREKLGGSGASDTAAEEILALL